VFVIFIFAMGVQRFSDFGTVELAVTVTLIHDLENDSDCLTLDPANPRQPWSTFTYQYAVQTIQSTQSSHSTYPKVTFKGSLSALSNGFDSLLSLFAVSAEILLWRQMALLLTMISLLRMLSLRITIIFLMVILRSS
jgi:hypothetical protein